MIGFVGLSHLGLVSSIATAAKGFDVIAYDADAALCAALGRGELPIHEPELPELLAASRERIAFTADAHALSKCRVIYFALDVPTDENNQSDLRPLKALIERLAPHAPHGCTLVVLSQVCPGFTRRIAQELHTAHASRNWHIHYQVETLIFGRAVERALHPERFIVGCADAQEALPKAYVDVLQAFGCPILPMRYESAELSKISINLCLVASVTVANTLAEICEAIGADWSEIVPTLKLDKRIGPHAYLTPGLGISGGNLERDLATVKNLSNEWGTDAGVVDAWLVNSRHRRDWVLRCLHRTLTPGPSPGVPGEGSKTVAVWGLTYKPGTGSLKNSPALALLEELRGFNVRAFDPQAAAPVESYPRLVQAADELQACDGADVLVIMTPWPQFASILLEQIARRLHGRTIIDPFVVFSDADCHNHGLAHYRLGNKQRRNTKNLSKEAV